MSNKLCASFIVSCGHNLLRCSSAAIHIAQDKRLPVTPSRILTAQEIANHAERARWTYTIELIDAESKRVLAEHDGSTPFDAPLTLARQFQQNRFCTTSPHSNTGLRAMMYISLLTLLIVLRRPPRAQPELNGNPKIPASRQLQNLERKPTSPSMTGSVMATIVNYNCLYWWARSAQSRSGNQAMNPSRR